MACLSHSMQQFLWENITEREERPFSDQKLESSVELACAFAVPVYDWTEGNLLNNSYRFDFKDKNVRRALLDQTGGPSSPASCLTVANQTIADIQWKHNGGGSQTEICPHL